MTELTLGVSLPGTVNCVRTILTIPLKRRTIDLIEKLLDAGGARSVLTVNHALNPLRALDICPRHFDHFVRIDELDAIILRVVIDDTAPAINANNRNNPLILLVRKRIDFPSKGVEVVLFRNNHERQHLLMCRLTAITLLECRCFQRCIELIGIDSEAGSHTDNQGISFRHGVSPM
ncbi:hypothetical protein D3C72_1344080 [compost metagenome]